MEGEEEATSEEERPQVERRLRPSSLVGRCRHRERCPPGDCIDAALSVHYGRWEYPAGGDRVVGRSAVAGHSFVFSVAFLRQSARMPSLQQQCFFTEDEAAARQRGGAGR